MRVVNWCFVTEAERQILDATIVLVGIYGMRKTSVGDIAERAALSRQTVYNLFANKDEIYRAAIEYLGAQWRAKAKAGLEAADGLSEKLDVVFDVFTVDAFKFSRSKPDAHDMFTEAHQVAGDVMQKFFRANRDIIADVLRPYAANLKKNGLTVEQFADQIETACRGYKRDARSLKHLKTLLATQKRVVLMMTA